MTQMKSPVPDLQKEVENLRAENQQLRATLEKFKHDCSRYRDLIENAADAIFLGDQDGQISLANQRALDLCGYSKSELEGMNIAMLFSEEETARAPLRYDLLQQGLAVRTERYLTRRDGSVVAVEMNSRVLKDGVYHTVIRDVSNFKRIEKSLRTSEEKFSKAFKLSPDSININRLDDGVYLEINQGFTDITGWTEEEVIGKSSLSPELNIWYDENDRHTLVQQLRRDGEVSSFIARFRTKSGNIIYGMMSARVIELNGELCLLNISRDLTEQIEAQNKQKKLEEQMLQAQKLESLGVLAGGIAHDFNNILMAVMGHCELAQRRIAKESPAHPNLAQIKLAAAKAADLANQMLAYSGRGKFVIEPLDINNLIVEMEHILAVSISKKVAIRYHLADNLPSIEADATQMRQVIMNLIINSSEAIGSNNGSISVSTSVQQCDRSYLSEIWLDDNLAEGHYVYIEIADTGCGIAKEDINRIFEPFYSTKFSGRGLGMAAVLGIVRGHNGAIKVYSEPGMGSTFKVLFPVSDVPASMLEGIEPHVDIKATGQVLLVDDEENIRDIGAAMLEELGFEVITAANGQDGLSLFREQHQSISFVLMDLTMPHMDGVEAFREFRRIDPAVKVIICSGYNEQDVTQKFSGKGLAGFLKKPYQLAELQKVISKIINN